MRRRILYLDLEGTIIDHWTNFDVLNDHVELIQDCIDAWDIERVGIFSYALWSPANRDWFLKSPHFEFFNNKFRNLLKSELVLQVQDMVDASKKINPKAEGLNTGYYWRFFSKEHAMLDYARVHHINDQYIALFDDMITHHVHSTVGGSGLILELLPIGHKQ